jgi:hypothetical protein
MEQNATIPGGEKVSDIQSLARRAQDLGNKVDWWNNRIIWVLVFAAAVALGTVVVTYMAFKRAKQLTDAQGELDAAKEKILQDDLDAKTLKIEEVKREASIANQRAAELLAVIQPRDLTVEQQKAIGAKLKKFSGRFVEILAYQDPECMRLGVIIRAAFREAGISSLVYPLEEGATTTPRTGIEATGTEEEFVKAVSDALCVTGHLEPAPKLNERVLLGGAMFIPNPPRTPSAIVYVGMKPLKFASLEPPKSAK